MTSNAESGDGYSDILVELEEDGLGIVIEVKYAEGGDFEKGCREAMAQIEDLRYGEALREDGMERVLKYGIACYKKRLQGGFGRCPGGMRTAALRTGRFASLRAFCRFFIVSSRK